MTLDEKPSRHAFRIQARCCLLIVLLGIIIYGNHLKNSFQFDSVAYIVNNQNLDSPQEMLTFDYWTRGVFSRSLVQMSLAMNAQLGHKNPFGYHLFNLALHIFNAILLFFITEKVCRNFLREPKLKAIDDIWVVSDRKSVV